MAYTEMLKRFCNRNQDVNFTLGDKIYIIESSMPKWIQSIVLGVSIERIRAELWMIERKMNTAMEVDATYKLEPIRGIKVVEPTERKRLNIKRKHNEL